MSTNQEYKFYNSRNSTQKAQAAIEYLMTYGWMLLAVSIIGGASFQQLGFQCVPTVTGFEGETVQLEDFAMNSEGELMLRMANTGRDQTEISTILVSEADGDGEAAVFQNLQLNASQEEAFSITSNAEPTTQECNEYQVEVNYEVGPLQNVESRGTFTGPIKSDEIPNPPIDVTANQ